jgi:hypothetical protein
MEGKQSQENINMDFLFYETFNRKSLRVTNTNFRIVYIIQPLQKDVFIQLKIVLKGCI